MVENASVKYVYSKAAYSVFFFFSIFLLTRSRGLLMFIVHNVIGGPVLELLC
jgi:hypothetical protein